MENLNLPPAGIDFRQFPAGCWYPPCLHAGYTLVSGSSSRRMDYLPRIESSRDPMIVTLKGRAATFVRF